MYPNFTDAVAAAHRADLLREAQARHLTRAFRRTRATSGRGVGTPEGRWMPRLHRYAAGPQAA
jgi:hypothetical protein